MKLASTRNLEELRPVLKNPESVGPDSVYWVFNDVSSDKWANMTIINNGLLDNEYIKTFGHYHGVDVNETYHIIEGLGVAVLQKKHIENGNLIPEMVDIVYLVKLKPGDEITYKPEYGHSLSNTGSIPLITYDDWRLGHPTADKFDYEPIEKQKGMAYYLVKEDDEIKAIANLNYKNLPEPIWLTAEEFKNLP